MVEGHISFLNPSSLPPKKLLYRLVPQSLFTGKIWSLTFAFSFSFFTFIVVLQSDLEMATSHTRPLRFTLSWYYQEQKKRVQLVYVKKMVENVIINTRSQKTKQGFCECC